MTTTITREDSFGVVTVQTERVWMRDVSGTDARALLRYWRGTFDAVTGRRSYESRRDGSYILKGGRRSRLHNLYLIEHQG